MEFGASFERHKHDAPILNEHGVQAEYVRNGLCPYHPDIQLRKKTRFGGWKTVKESCPKCDSMQSPSLPATQSQPSTQIPTTSIPSPIAKILSKMRMNEQNANIQKEGLFKLWNLAYNNDNNKVTIAEAGGITTILSAMKTHSSNATVQEYGCAALQNLASNNDKNRVKISNAGGKALIESAMRNYSSNAGVQEKGKAALCNLTHCGK